MPCAPALRVCETYLAARAPPECAAGLRPYAFVYLSAEDMGRPFIPRRYIETKREAEQGIARLCAGTDVRGVFIRPSDPLPSATCTRRLILSLSFSAAGFIYHPHLRPITSPIAALAALSATVHERAPSVVPTPGRILRALASDPPSPTETPSALHALATTFELAPIHLDHVGEAVCKSIERQDISGPVGVKQMRHLIGWGQGDGDLTERESI